MVIRRVVLVDDQEMFTEALTVLLSAEADLRVVGRSVIDNPDLSGWLARLRPDVVTVDVESCVEIGSSDDPEHRPEHGGRATTDLLQLVSARPDAHVVVLTASRDIRQMVAAARAGAAAWLSKERASGELAATIRAVCAGHACYPPDRLAAVLRALSAGAPQDTTLDPLAILTRQERRVLVGLVDGRSGPEIAAELGLSPGTVRSHTRNVFAKLGVHSRLQAVRFARSAGLRPQAE